MENIGYKPGRTLTLWMLILSLIGLVDSGYLVYKHYFHVPLVCPVFGGCDRVLNSQYAQIFGIPVAVIGLVYYLLVALLLSWYRRGERLGLIQLATSLVTVGFLVSLGLVYLQLVALKSICFYCMLSALITTALFITSLPILTKSK